jgi:hypothetical protein
VVKVTLETFDISEGSEKILRRALFLLSRSKNGCNEFARELVADEGEGKSSGGAGRVWNSVTATDRASS